MANHKIGSQIPRTPPANKGETQETLPSEVNANQNKEIGKSQTVTSEVRNLASGRVRPPLLAASAC